MDAAERADTLLAHLDALIAMGRLDAARELGAELRQRVREACAATPRPPAPDRRAVVLRPLVELLRRQRALRRELDSVEPRSLAPRQRAFVDQLAPLRDGAAARTTALSSLRTGLQAVTLAAEAAANALDAGSVGEATAAMNGAVDGLVSTMRRVDEALGSPAPSEDVPQGFLSRFLARRLPAWELPRELSFAMHGPAAESDAGHRRVLLLISQHLSEAAGEPQVRLRGGHGLDEGGYQGVEVPLTLDGQRYLCVLLFTMEPGGGVRPARPSWTMQPYGGAAVCLLDTDLEEARLIVLRLDDSGGAHRDLLPLDRAHELATAVDATLRERFPSARDKASPVAAEVLHYLDAMAAADESPVSEADLRQLGIPWYEPADFVDLLRPVHEALRYRIVETNERAPEFPGLHWLQGDDAALVRLGWDDEEPVITIPNHLLRYLGWLAAREFREDEPPQLRHLLAAIQLHLGVKLAFWDRLLAEGDEACIERVALAVERDYLAGVGADSDALRDMLSRIVTRHREAIEAPADETPYQRWSRKISDLFEARAGEEFVKSGLVPMSTLFSAYRGALQQGLANRGRTRAARSAHVLGEFRDAAVLFGNLVSDPESNSGVLIVGDGKVGKSSVMGRLVDPGRDGQPPWRYHASDRVLVLAPEDGPLIAFPSPAHRSFGQWTQELWFRDANHREIRPPDQLPSRAVVPLRGVVFLRRDAGNFATRGLSERALLDWVEDGQSRYGFVANTRFWWALSDRVASLDVPLRHRSAASFRDAAERIRAWLPEAVPGRGAMPLTEVQVGDTWYGVLVDGGVARITRIGADGLDVDTRLFADGSADVRPSQLGRSVRQLPAGSYDWGRLEALVEIDPARVEQHGGRPHHRLARGRAMPLSSEYFREVLGGPRLHVPAPPPEVVSALKERMGGVNAARWAGWSGA